MFCVWKNACIAKMLRKVRSYFTSLSVFGRLHEPLHRNPSPYYSNTNVESNTLVKGFFRVFKYYLHIIQYSSNISFSKKKEKKEENSNSAFNVHIKDFLYKSLEFFLSACLHKIPPMKIVYGYCHCDLSLKVSNVSTMSFSGFLKIEEKEPDKPQWLTQHPVLDLSS